MIGPLWLAIQLVLFGTAQLVLFRTASIGAAALPHAQGSAIAQSGGEKPTFSPLHDFLGIDPDTGQFVEPKPEPAESDDDRSSTAGASAGERDGEADGGGPPERVGATSSEDLPKEAEEAARAIRQMTERINEGSLDDLSAVVGERLSTERLTRLSHQFAWITAGLLLLYPLSMVLSELLGWWFQRHESGLSDLDRQYRRTRLRRRLSLAATLIGLIVTAAIGSVNAYWWHQPELFTLFCIATGLLGIAAATLAGLIKQSAKHYSMMLMRQMHREQLEIRAELDELCRRMRQVTINQ